MLLFLVSSLYVTLSLTALRGRSSNKYCVTVYVSIFMQFSSLFQNGMFL